MRLSAMRESSQEGENVASYNLCFALRSCISQFWHAINSIIQIAAVEKIKYVICSSEFIHLSVMFLIHKWSDQ